MGSNFAHDLADYDLGLDLSTAIGIHGTILIGELNGMLLFVTVMNILKQN